MSSWLPPPPPPPRPRYPTLIPDEDDDGAKTIPQFITQFIFLIILLVCQNPELMLIPRVRAAVGLATCVITWVNSTGRRLARQMNSGV